MENRAAMPRDHGDDNILKKFLRWFVDWAVVTDMPVEVFTQKLADNRIVGNAAALTDEVIKDIAQKYEAFCAEVGAYFESRARLLSVLIAFAVAWFFYVHPYKLAVTYFKILKSPRPSPIRPPTCKPNMQCSWRSSTPRPRAG